MSLYQASKSNLLHRIIIAQSIQSFWCLLAPFVYHVACKALKPHDAEQLEVVKNAQKNPT